MHSFSPDAIVGRIRALIQRVDGGDLAAAAARAGIPPSALAGLLEDAPQPFDADALGAIAEAYDVDPTWLLLGEPDLPVAQLPHEDRLRIAELLSALSARILRRYAKRESRAARAITGAVQELARREALYARHPAAVAGYEAQRARFLESVAEYQALRLERQAEAEEHRRAAEERRVMREARAQLREAVRRYVEELRAERVPLHRALLSVDRVVRDAAQAADGTPPPQSVDALAVEAVQWAIDTYTHAA